MKQINLLGKGMKTLSFDKDGIYTVGNYDKSHVRFCEIPEDEITSLKDNIDKVTFPSIVDGDVIYFDKNTSFPKLMLGRLDLNVKRTVKKDKCTKIVAETSTLISKEDLDSLESGFVIMVGGTDETDFSQIFYISDDNIQSAVNEGISLDLMQKYFKGRWIKVVILNDKVTDASIQLIKSNPDKITTVQQVAAYLNSKLPALDDESAKTMISLFKSNSEEKKLAVNMLASFNVSNILFDICYALGESGTSFDINTKNSINYKYFSILLGCNPAVIESNFRKNYWYSGGIIADLFHNGLLTSDQKEKTWKYFFNVMINDEYHPGYQLSSYEKDRFDRYNMPYPYDSKRETINSDSEMEGSQV